MKPFKKIQQRLVVLDVANGAKDSIDNKQEGVLASNLHFRESAVRYKHKKPVYAAKFQHFFGGKRSE